MSDPLWIQRRPCLMHAGEHTVEECFTLSEVSRLRTALAAAEADRDKAEENERVLADILLSESVPTDDVHREIKARVDSGKIPPFIVCGWCGAPGGTMEAYKEHAVTCSANPAVQRAAAAEAERDEAKRMWNEWRGLCFKAQENAEAAETRAKEAEEALRGLVRDIDAVVSNPSYVSVFHIAAIHGVKYDGPAFLDSLAAARRALSSSPGAAIRQGDRE